MYLHFNATYCLFVVFFISAMNYFELVVVSDYDLFHNLLVNLGDLVEWQ